MLGLKSRCSTQPIHPLFLRFRSETVPLAKGDKAPRQLAGS